MGPDFKCNLPAKRNKGQDCGTSRRHSEINSEHTMRPECNHACARLRGCATWVLGSWQPQEHRMQGAEATLHPDCFIQTVLSGFYSGVPRGSERPPPGALGLGGVRFRDDGTTVLGLITVGSEATGLSSDPRTSSGLTPVGKTVLNTPQLPTKAIEYVEQMQILMRVGSRNAQTTQSGFLSWLEERTLTRAVFSFPLCAMARSTCAPRLCRFVTRRRCTADGSVMATTTSRCVCIDGVLGTCIFDVPASVDPCP
jgi:hypothetical protein